MKYVKNSDGLAEYYGSANITDKEPVIIESLKPHEAYHVMTKMAHVKQLALRMETGEYQPLIDDYEPYEMCNAKRTYSNVSRNIINDNLREELKAHNQTVSGVKQELMERLMKHYNRYHPNEHDGNSDCCNE